MWKEIQWNKSRWKENKQGLMCQYRVYKDILVSKDPWILRLTMKCCGQWLLRVVSAAYDIDLWPDFARFALVQYSRNEMNILHSWPSFWCSFVFFWDDASAWCLILGILFWELRIPSWRAMPDSKLSCKCRVRKGAGTTEESNSKQVFVGASAKLLRHVYLPCVHRTLALVYYPQLSVCLGTGEPHSYLSQGIFFQRRPVTSSLFITRRACCSWELQDASCLWPVSFVVGYFPEIFLFDGSCLIASGGWAFSDSGVLIRKTKHVWHESLSVSHRFAGYAHRASARERCGFQLTQQRQDHNTTPFHKKNLTNVDLYVRVRMWMGDFNDRIPSVFLACFYCEKFSVILGVERTPAILQGKHINHCLDTITTTEERKLALLENTQISFFLVTD